MRKVFGRLLWIPAALFMAFAVISVFVSVIKNGTGNGGATFWTAAAKKQADEIAINCSDEEQKVKAFYEWIIANIKYNYNFNEKYQYFDADKTLETKKGICYDYANLFAAFCRTQNITCYVIDGYKRTDPNAKHTWNRLYFNESWWNVDLTYDAQCRESGSAVYGFKKLINGCDSPDDEYVITRIY